MRRLHDQAKFGSMLELVSSNIEIDPVGAIVNRRLVLSIPSYRQSSIQVSSSHVNSFNVLTSVSGITPLKHVSTSSNFLGKDPTEANNSETSSCSGKAGLPISVTILIDASNAVRAKTLATVSQNVSNSFEPYTIFIKIAASANPIRPNPTGRIAFVLCSIFGNGYEQASMTRSR